MKKKRGSIWVDEKVESDMTKLEDTANIKERFDNVGQMIENSLRVLEKLEKKVDNQENEIRTLWLKITELKKAGENIVRPIQK